MEDAHINIKKEQLKLQKDLKEHLADLIIMGAEQIIETHLDKEQHQRILLDISNKIYDTK